ncbi:MAG: bile acid:sodium symporter [Opitutaceae bacterium]|nr:bile acid:sodium symporter [Opitutaceae bacterium]
MSALEKRKLRPDWFLWAVFGAAGLAALAPGIGAAGGPLHSEIVTKAGVMIAFYVYGLTLSFAALKGGALNWRLHLAVQAATFGLFPLIAFVALSVAGERLSPDLALGFVYLCALPSTISSAVALTAVARGNVAGAVFNATLSSLLGVVLTPLWLHALGGVAGGQGDLGRAILDIARLLVLPMVLGQACRPFLADWAARHRAKLQLTDRLLILFLVYATFCDSFVGGVWRGKGWELLIGVTLGSAVLFAIVSAVMAWVARVLGFGHGDAMALMFCGTQKSLAQGVTMSRVLLAAHPAAGLVLLPLMIYHALQLLVGGVLAPHWSRSDQGGHS